MRTFFSDLHFAARLLSRSPGFAVAAVLSLALGMGANTAIFSLIDSVLLSMLPVAHPEQLRFVNTNAIQSGNFRVSESMTLGTLKAMQERARTALGLCASEGRRQLNVVVDGQADLASGEFVSGNYFAMLGVPPLIGRMFVPSEDTPDGRVAVIGYGYWQRRFGGHTGAVGRSITVNGVPYTISGVARRDFYGASPDSVTEVFLPRATLPQVEEGRLSGKAAQPSDSAGVVLARVKPGTEKRAAAELTTIFRQAALTVASSSTLDRAAAQKIWIELAPAGRGFSTLRARFAEPLEVLMVVAGLVMLIACANIANLLLAKASARRREIAIRLSLGSSRSRLVRQLLTEGLLLSGLGAALGLLLAEWARAGILFLSMQPGASIPSASYGRVLAFTAVILVVNALLFGIAPAWRATRSGFAETLQGGRMQRALGRLPLARFLVLAQLALSLALLAGAGLFLGTLRNLDRVDLGFARDRALMVSVDPTLAGYSPAASKEVYSRLWAAAGRVPGVRSVSIMGMRLLSDGVKAGTVLVPGYIPRPGEEAGSLWVVTNEVTPGFFAHAGMRLVSGREFTDRDTEGAPPVAIINQTMARHFFGSRNPIGEAVAWDRDQPAMTIVAVVRDFKIFGVRGSQYDAMFTPFLQSKTVSSATLLVRSAGDPLRVASGLRAALRSVDPKLPQFDLTTMEAHVASSFAQEKLIAILASGFSVLALSLAAIGLYGVVSYGVAERIGEIGLRMALGAERREIVRLILGETARLAFVGIPAGIGIAFLGAHAVEKMLYGVTSVAGWPLASAVILLAAIALIAGFLPAWRAAQVDPMTALRHD